MSDNVDDFLRNLGDPSGDDEASYEAGRTAKGAADLLRGYADRVESGEIMPEFVLIGLDLREGRFDLGFRTNMKFSKTLVALSRATHFANSYIDKCRDHEGD